MVALAVVPTWMSEGFVGVNTKKKSEHLPAQQGSRGVSGACGGVAANNSLPQRDEEDMQGHNSRQTQT